MGLTKNTFQIILALIQTTPAIVHTSARSNQIKNRRGKNENAQVYSLMLYSFMTILKTLDCDKDLQPNLKFLHFTWSHCLPFLDWNNISCWIMSNLTFQKHKQLNTNVSLPSLQFTFFFINIVSIFVTTGHYEIQFVKIGIKIKFWIIVQTIPL